MDPLSLAAIVGLVFAGKKFSETPDVQPRPKPTKPITRQTIDLMAQPANHYADAFDFHNTTPDVGRRVGDTRLQPKDAVENLQDMKKTNSRLPYGQPVYDLYNREYITNKMNNISPLERPMNIGPGLGIDANVAASGGFQDYFRALPINVNEERLTTLEGREGPSSFFIKGGATVIGDITHPASASKTIYRAPAAYGGGGAQSAMVGTEGRPEFVKMKRMTIRSETGLRTDTLSTGTAQYNVQQPYAVGDSYTDTTLTRSSGFRAKPAYTGNGSRMNVRIDPLQQGGSLTQLRNEAKPVQPGPMGTTGTNQGRGIKAPQFDDPLNEFKCQPNPRGDPDFLDIAIQQLDKNPLALSLAVS